MLTQLEGAGITAIRGADATRARLLAEFRSGDYDAIHFAGHAWFDAAAPASSGILCAGGRVLSGADLAAMDSVPALVFFNACESGRLRATVNPLRQLDRSVGFAEAFLRGGVANFIGTWWPVSDSAASAFATTLYRDLAKGESIGDALNAARSSVRALPSADWANYLHYGSFDFALKAPEALKLSAMARIASLHVYPVKSCRGIDVDSFLLTPTGPEWDRRWMIVTGAEGQFITQRTHPKMATIAIAIDGKHLRLAAPGCAPIEVPVDHAGRSWPVIVWKSECLGIDAGDSVADWLSAVLGEPLRLVRHDPARTRLANAQYAGPEPHPVSFADAYPILMISRESLVELNRRLPDPIPMARFRPNVVIDGVDRARRGRNDPLPRRGDRAARDQALRPLPHHDHRPTERSARPASGAAADARNLSARLRAEGRHLRPELRRRGGRRRAALRRRRPLDRLSV